MIRSLGASTKVAPKYRPYKEIHETKKERDAKGGGKKYEITTWRGGQKKTFNIRSPKGVKELKQMPQVKIGNRGLAKASWRAAGAGIGRKSAVKKSKKWGKWARRSAGRNVDVEKSFETNDAYVRITNELDYITDSMKGGDRAVDTAMARAAEGMRHHIDEEIKKKLGVKK